MEEYKYMVRVNCMTYNHSLYIEDAMDGFCMQETSFPFVCTIVDDASTDGEQEVIKNYLQQHFDLDDASVVRNEETDDYYLTFARHKTNKNCYFAVYFLKYNHYQIKKTKAHYFREWNGNVKYVARCEGDDYWIHSGKLQMQVDFLETHPEHSLCIHAHRKDMDEEDGSVSSVEVIRYPYDVETVSDKDVLKGTGMFAATATMVYRVDALVNYPLWAKIAPVGDRPLQLVLFSRGKIGYFAKVMSVYRVGVQGSWTLRILNNTKERKTHDERLIQMYKDFDVWTNRKYHSYIVKGLFNYRMATYKSNIVALLKTLLSR